MRFELYVAMRYLRAKRKNRFVNLIALISVAGVTVGVVALIVIMSVMTGFDNELRSTIVGTRAHLKLTLPGRAPMPDAAEALAELERAPEAVAASPYIEVEALLQRGADSAGALIVGIDPARETKVTDLEANLTGTAGRIFGQGRLPGPDEVVLGYRLASRLGARVGAELAVLTGKAVATPFGMRGGDQGVLRVVGIAESRNLDYDTLYAFTDLGTARRLAGRDDGVDGVHARLRDPFDAQALAARIDAGGRFDARTWYEDEEAFFDALKVEKAAMFVILAFIVVVAAFNITSTLIMVVMEKRRDIGILRTFGASTPSIVAVFVLEGLLIGLGGTLAGLAGGLLLAANVNPVAAALARLFGVDIHQTPIYYYEGIPADIIPRDVALVAVCAVLLALASTIYPAWRAARLRPVDALRYE